MEKLIETARKIGHIFRQDYVFHNDESNQKNNKTKYRTIEGVSNFKYLATRHTFLYKII